MVLVARSERKLERLAAALETRGVTATPIVMDLDHAAAAEALYEEVLDRELDIGVLVNNVGVGTTARSRKAISTPSGRSCG